MKLMSTKLSEITNRYTTTAGVIKNDLRAELIMSVPLQVVRSMKTALVLQV